jgi:hypothetical protein
MKIKDWRSFKMMESTNSHKLLASMYNEHFMSEQYLSAIRKKIYSGRKVGEAQFFNVIMVHRLRYIIANYSMEQYIKDIELYVTSYGVLKINIVKTDKCEILTHDPGDGFPNLEWLENSWKPFIDAIRKDFELFYDVSEGYEMFLTIKRKKPFNYEELQKNEQR